MAILYLVWGEIFSAFITILSVFSSSIFHTDPCLWHPVSLDRFQFEDLAMIYSKLLIWSGLDGIVLNSEWFPKQVEILPICCSNGNAAYPPIWLLSLYSSHSQTSNRVKAAEYILCKFIEHRLPIHQHQHCFSSQKCSPQKIRPEFSIEDKFLYN